jgi:DNA-binding NarL/FixJ family response regulator
VSAASDQPTVLIVDQLPLRTLGLVAVLNRLSGAYKFRVASLTAEDAKRWVDAGTPCSMIIYNVGGASLAERRHARRIKTLRARAAGTPLVVFSDSDNREEVTSAFRVGAQGFLYAGTDAECALQALSFILNRGSYFPSAIAAKRRPSGRLDGATNASSATEEPELHLEGVHDAPQHAVETGWNNRLTNRQKAVLGRLGKGESNKAIARQLGIREGTVKVHVRQIMRKLGAANRTQIAIACASNGGLETPPDRRRIKSK